MSKNIIKIIIFSLVIIGVIAIGYTSLKESQLAEKEAWEEKQRLEAETIAKYPALRNIVWDLSPKEVYDLEENYRYSTYEDRYINDDDEIRWLTYSDTTYFLEGTTEFNFENEKLYSITYRCSDTGYMQYDATLRALNKQYETDYKIEEGMVWSNELFKNDKSKWNDELKAKTLDISHKWETPSTDIKLYTVENTVIIRYRKHIK